MDFTNPLPFRHQRDAHLPKPLDISMALLSPKPDEAQQGKELRPTSNSFRTSAPPPRTPLPPHKLAKLANALGVSTPMPAFYNSPSPSGSSSFRSSSRYLLHIVPPAYFPPDEDDDGPDPDGASVVSASSYRSQFRRGTLIPLYPTLQSQLGAIAREYNLPTTGGLVLYLVQSSQGGASEGPRISDDVWKLLWHKALQAERQDAQPRTASSLGFRSGHSTPSSPCQNHNRDLPPSLPTAPRAPSSPCPYPSPLTSSTPSSEAYLPLSDQRQMSASELASLASNLTPNPFLPILAKVEFDLDRRKAGWFDAWAHDKRERSRWRNGSEGGRIQLELPLRSESRSQIRFAQDISTNSRGSGEYAPLDDAEGENTAVDDDEQDQPTVVVRQQDPLADVFGNDAETWTEMHAERQGKGSNGLGISTADPELIIPHGSKELDHKEGIEAHDEADVVKLWDENHRPTLTLVSPDPPDLPRKMAPPPLKLTPSADPETSIMSPPLIKGRSVLPYLNGLSPLESESGGSGGEKYHDRRMRRRTGVVFGDLQIKIVEDSEQLSDTEFIGHRSSQVVMKHKLDRLEKQLAELSPRQLTSSPSPMPPGKHEHETDTDRPLRSAPPGVGKFTHSRSTHTKRSPSVNTPPCRPDASNPTGPVARVVNHDQSPPRKESIVTSVQPPRTSEHKRAQSSQSSSSASSAKSSHDQSVAAWPSVAYSSLPKSPALPGPPTLPSRLPDRPPPQLTIERASGAFHMPVPTEVSLETQARAFESEGQDVLLQERPGGTLPGNPNSPVIPLSPDPFGKRPLEDLRQPRLPNESKKTSPSANEARPPSKPQGTVLPASVPENGELDTQSSRFSADSEQGVEELSKQRRSRSNSIMSVRSLRNLWRKSSTPGKGSGSSMPPPPMPGDPSPLLPSLGTAPKHSRGESIASLRSVRSTIERTRRPSLAPRPDSGSDPFQFDNADIYKSASSSSLASAAAPAVPNYASSAGSINQSKGILKGWTGNANPSDAEARRMRRPSLANTRRSMSTTSASLSSDLGDLPIESQQSTPPSSPPDVRHASAKPKPAHPSSQEPMLVPRSLPTAHGLSRSTDGSPSLLSLSSSLDVGLEGSSTPQSLEFEIVAPPTRSAGLIPSSSYNGEVF